MLLVSTLGIQAFPEPSIAMVNADWELMPGKLYRRKSEKSLGTVASEERRVRLREGG